MLKSLAKTIDIMPVKLCLVNPSSIGDDAWSIGIHESGIGIDLYLLGCQLEICLFG